MLPRTVVVLLLWLLLPGLVSAQRLTEAQYALLHDDIVVTNAAEFQQYVNNANYQPIVEAYNLLKTPLFWVWRSSLSEKEVYEATSPDGTKWSWSTYKSQTVQDRDSWARMFNPGVVNPSLQQTRDGWLAIFGGQGASAAQVNYLLSLGRRQALRAEALFANTAAGNGQAATPANLSMEGKITYTDVNHAVSGAPLQ
jgi:hypothetical protein